MPTKTLVWPSLVALLVLAGPAHADVYKWVDENGSVHFSDSPPPKGRKAERMNLDDAPVSTIKFPSPRNAESQNAGEKAESNNKPRALADKVDLYITDWCQYCKKAIAFLRANGVAFKTYDIEKDQAAARRVRLLGGNGSVPFAVINGRTIAGFSADAYRQLLNQR